MCDCQKWSDHCLWPYIAIRTPSPSWRVKIPSTHTTHPAQEISWGRVFDPYTPFCLICTISSELKYFLIFNHLSEPRLMSARLQLTGSTPAGFQKAFRVEMSESRKRTKNVLNANTTFFLEQQLLHFVFQIDWSCFYYFVRNSVVALLEALCARSESQMPEIDRQTRLIEKRSKILWSEGSCCGAPKKGYVHYLCQNSR